MQVFGRDSSTAATASASETRVEEAPLALLGSPSRLPAARMTARLPGTPPAERPPSCLRRQQPSPGQGDYLEVVDTCC